MTDTRAHDCLVNANLGDEVQVEWMQRVKNEYFKREDSIFGKPDMAALIDEMDRNGVQRAILMTTLDAQAPTALKFAEARPDRFSLSLGGLNLLTPMATIRRIEGFIRNVPVVNLTIGPAFWGDGLYPPDHAVYFPLYTKCCEWELPLCMNAGIPGPPIPCEAQNPIHFDRVCVRFPELKLCMIHGADPWWETAIRLMVKYPNLHLMTSAWAPKYLPEVLLHYMRTRGKKKVMFASDWPILSIDRTIGEARKLNLPADVMDDWLYGNAQRFFFDRLDGQGATTPSA